MVTSTQSLIGVAANLLAVAVNVMVSLEETRMKML